MRTFGKLALASVSLIAFAVPAFAQDTAAKDTDEAGYDAGEEIVVQARRKDESLQDVPLTVNAVTSESLQKFNIRDMKDIAGVVPGLVLNPGNRTTGNTVSMRGLNVDNTASGNNGTVEFYQNDAPISAGVVLQSLFDVGQIEVLRGPQGTLRGRAAPSGSITITTKKPDMDEWGGYAQATVNSIGGINGQAALNVPLLPGVLALRVAGLVDDNEGSRVTSLNNQGYEPYNKSRGVRVSLRATPVDGLEVNGSYTHLVKNSVVWDQVESVNLATGAAPVGTQIVAKQRLAVENVPNANHVGFDVFNWQAQYSLFGQKLSYVGSYTKQDLRSTEPQDKGDFFGTAYPGDASLPNNNGTYTTIPTTNLQNIAQPTHSYPKQESHEFRLSSEDRIFGIADYTVGFFINKLTPWTDLVSITPLFAGAPSPATFVSILGSPVQRRGRTLERSFFGNLTLHLGENAEIAGGVRHIDYRENVNSPGNLTDAKWSPWIWNASVKYRFNDDLMVYANAGSSWRVGSGTNGLILASSRINVAGITDPYLAMLNQQVPETSKSYEIGLRSTWLDRKLTLNVSAFHQDFSNYIYSVPRLSFNVANNTGTVAAPAYTQLIANRSGIAVPVPAKVDGVEAEISFRPTPDINVGATVAYANARIVNGSIPITAANLAAITAVPNRQVLTKTVNQKASLIAPFTASLQGEYTRPINDNVNAFIRGLVSIYGNSQNDPTNPYDDVKSYALTNLYLGVRSHDGAWEVTAYAKNLFNTLRVLSRDDKAAPVFPNGSPNYGSNYRLISTTEPREFGINLRYAFGSR